MSKDRFAVGEQGLNREQRHLVRQLEGAQRRLRKAKSDVEILRRKALNAGVPVEDVSGQGHPRQSEEEKTKPKIFFRIIGCQVHMFDEEPWISDRHSHTIAEVTPTMANALHRVLVQSPAPDVIYQRGRGEPRGPQNWYGPVDRSIMAAD